MKISATLVLSLTMLVMCSSAPEDYLFYILKAPVKPAQKEVETASTNRTCSAPIGK